MQSARYFGKKSNTWRCLRKAPILSVIRNFSVRFIFVHSSRGFLFRRLDTAWVGSWLETCQVESVKDLTLAAARFEWPLEFFETLSWIITIGSLCLMVHELKAVRTVRQGFAGMHLSMKQVLTERSCRDSDSLLTHGTLILVYRSNLPMVTVITVINILDNEKNTNDQLLGLYLGVG